MKLKFTSKWIWAISLTAGLASAIAISLTTNSIHAEQQQQFHENEKKDVIFFERTRDN